MCSPDNILIVFFLFLALECVAKVGEGRREEGGREGGDETNMWNIDKTQCHY